MGNEWTGNAQDTAHWRESHYKAEGPVVSQMQAVFVDNWIKATGRVLHGSEYFPTTAADDPARWMHRCSAALPLGVPKACT